jgi:hypothetical protein
MNALVDRRYELEFTTDIPEDYGLQWAMLAADFRAVGMFHNAALCDRHAEYYEEPMPIEMETRQVMLVDPFKIYSHGQVITNLPPIVIYENGQRCLLEVVSRTELDDSLVILEVTK